MLLLVSARKRGSGSFQILKESSYFMLVGAEYSSHVASRIRFSRSIGSWPGPGLGVYIYIAYDDAKVESA